MKISINAMSNMRDIIEHSKDITLGVREDTDVVLWDFPREIPQDLLDKVHLNNCPAVVKLLSKPELMKEFRSQFSFAEGNPSFNIYGFLSAKQLGPCVEMAVRHSFMTGDVGMYLGYVQNTALPCTEDMYLAIPNLKGIVEGLQAIGYLGEISFLCSSTFEVVDVVFGHQVAAYSLMCEMGMQHPQKLFEFSAGGEPYALHQDRIAVNTLLSYPPYPYSTDVPFSILAPTGAEKHLYRYKIGMCELAYAATWGCDITEAKRRCRRTIDGCKNYYLNIQHRVDYGWKDKFFLNADRYKELGGTV